MSAVDTLLDSLRATLPGALDSAIQEELRNCVDEFCRHTDAYRQIVDIPLTIGETSYSLIPSGAVIVRVFSIAHPGLDTRGSRYDMVDRLVLLSNEPQDFHVAEPLTLEVSLTVDKTVAAVADWLPAEVWERFYHAFLEGTLGRMHGQAAKPYSAQQKAAYHLSRFRRKMLEYRHDAAVGFAPGGQTWSFPRFAR